MAESTTDKRCGRRVLCLRPQFVDAGDLVFIECVAAKAGSDAEDPTTVVDQSAGRFNGRKFGWIPCDIIRPVEAEADMPGHGSRLMGIAKCSRGERWRHRSQPHRKRFHSENADNSSGANVAIRTHQFDHRYKYSLAICEMNVIVARCSYCGQPEPREDMEPCPTGKL
jgi:hypothetical protein